MIDPSRRSILKYLGASAVTASAIGTVSANSKKMPSTLRLFSEQSVAGAMEVVTEQNHAYVATGDGMAVVDIRNPGRPETVATVDLASDIEANLGIEDPSVEILDVKVDGDIAALANNDGAENPGGISLYDVSDPANPQFLSQYDPDLGGPSPGANIHNCFLADGYAYLTVAEPWNVDTDGDGEREEVWFFGDTGVDIADISDPSNPENASTWLLKDVAPAEAKSIRAPCHDIYVQNDVCYAALWDAGTAALDVSDPENPTLISKFGSVLDASDAVPPWDVETDFGAYLAQYWDIVAYLTAPGNAHYVQHSPDGNHVYVGAETFPKDVGISDPGLNDYGGITVFDTSDLENPVEVARIDPPVIDEDDTGKLFTSHNFDVTANRLYSSWYHGGVHVYDITDPANPERLAGYDPDGYAFWTAVRDRGFTIGGIYGAASENAGGVALLHEDRGTKQSPGFDGSTPPGKSDVMPENE